MRIKYKRQTKRRREAMDLWLKIANRFNEVRDAQVVADEFINPITKRPYTREHIYWVLKQVKNIPAGKFKK